MPLDPHDELDLLMRMAREGLPPMRPDDPMGAVLLSLLAEVEDAEARSERRQTEREHRDDYREEMGG